MPSISAGHLSREAPPKKKKQGALGRRGRGRSPMYVQMYDGVPMVDERSSPDDASRTSGLSDEAEKADVRSHVGTTAPQPTIEQLTDLDHALMRVSACMRAIRGTAEAAKRRREFLDAAIRGNLCEMPDGQFMMIQTEKDRYNMLATIMGADQTFSESNRVFHHAFNKTMLGLRAIAEENGPITRPPLARPS